MSFNGSSAAGRRALAALVGLLLALPSLAHAAEPTPTLDRLRNGQPLRVTLRDTSAPFAFKNERGRPQGFSWALCSALIEGLEKELGRAIAVKTEFVDLKRSFETLENDQADLHCGSTTRTAEREQRVGFSTTFFVAGVRVAYRADDARFALEDAGARVIAVKGSTALNLARKRVGPGAADAVREVANYAEGVALLKSQAADLFYADAVLVPADGSIAFRERPLTVEPYGLLVRKSDTAFLAELDRRLIRILSEDGRRLAAENGLAQRLNPLTLDAWKRPTRIVAPSLY